MRTAEGIEVWCSLRIWSLELQSSGSSDALHLSVSLAGTVT